MEAKGNKYTLHICIKVDNTCTQCAVLCIIIATGNMNILLCIPIVITGGPGLCSDNSGRGVPSGVAAQDHGHQQQGGGRI